MIDKVFRRALHKLLGDEKYITFLSNIFLKMYHSGKAKKKYPEMYLLHHFVSEGNTCIDIGANLGYYTIPLAEIVGSKGKIYAVEPVSLFQKVLKKNIRRYKLSDRIEILPYALGKEDGIEITMGTPSVNGLVHFGYTKILTTDDTNISNKYSVKMFTPQTLFNELTELHFIKCDVEGFEKYVIPGFVDLINKFKPALQVEICSIEVRELIIDLLKPLNYLTYFFNGKRLVELKNLKDNLENNCDLYFLYSPNIDSLID